MCYEGTLCLVQTYISLASEHFGLGIYLNDEGKYVLNYKGCIVAKVHWHRNTYYKGERPFDTYRDSMYVNIGTRAMEIEVLNTENNQLVVDFVSLVWQGNYVELMANFKSDGHYMTDCMIRTMYDADIEYVKKIS